MFMRCMLAAKMYQLSYVNKGVFSTIPTCSTTRKSSSLTDISAQSTERSLVWTIRISDTIWHLVAGGYLSCHCHNRVADQADTLGWQRICPGIHLANNSLVSMHDSS